MLPPRQAIWNLYRRVTTSQHDLLYLFLEITRSCNLSCRHCGSDCSRAAAAPTLDPASWFSIVDYVCGRFSPDLIFAITGGEPLTCPFLPELGRRIAERGRRWGIVTNGFALDEPMLGSLVSAGLSSITVSLDGDREAHTFIRNNPLSYDRAVRAVGLVAASDIPWKDVVTCLFPGNLAMLDGIADQLLRLGMRRWRLFRIFPRGRAKDDPRLLLSPEQSRQLIRWIAEKRPALRKAGLTVDCSCEGWLPYGLDRKVRTEPFFCRAGVNIASILCDGSVTGCPNNGPAFTVGNVLRDDLARLWEGSFGLFRDRAWMKRGPCADCRHFRACGGGSIHLWENREELAAPCFMREA